MVLSCLELKRGEPFKRSQELSGFEMKLEFC